MRLFSQDRSTERPRRQVQAERDLRHHGGGNVSRTDLVLCALHTSEATAQPTLQKIFPLFDARGRGLTCRGRGYRGLLATTARKLQYIRLFDIYEAVANKTANVYALKSVKLGRFVFTMILSSYFSYYRKCIRRARLLRHDVCLPRQYNFRRRLKDI